MTAQLSGVAERVRERPVACAGTREHAALTTGQSRAWEAIYRAYERPLYGYCYRLCGDAHLATDIVQEAFLRTIARVRDLEESFDVKSYLYTAVRNLYFKHREKHGRVSLHGDVGGEESTVDAGAVADDAPIELDPQRALLLDEQQELLRDAVSRLPDRQRMALALCDLEDCSYAEVAQMLDLNENSVAQLILRARTKLKLELRLLHTDRTLLPKECLANLPLISRMMDDQLPARQATTLQSHLAGCGPCAQALHDFEEARFRFRGTIPPIAITGASGSSATHDERWQLLAARARSGRLLSVDEDLDLDALWIGAAVTGEPRRSSRAWLTVLVLLLFGGSVAGLVTPDDRSLRRVDVDLEAASSAPGRDVAIGSHGGNGEDTATPRHVHKTRGRDDDDVGDSAEKPDPAAPDAAPEPAGAPDEQTPTSGHRRPRPGGGSPSPGGSGDGGAPTSGDGAPGGGGGVVDPGDATTPPTSGGSGDAATPPPPPPSDPVVPATPTYPDLYVSGLSNTGTSVTVTVTNGGDAAAGSSTVRATLGGSSKTGSIGSLAVGASATITLTFGGCAEGTFTVSGTADYGGGVAESNEGNNASSETVTWIC